MRPYFLLLATLSVALVLAFNDVVHFSYEREETIDIAHQLVAKGEGDPVKLAAARAIASRFIAKEPGHARALFVRAWAAQRQGDPTSALADYERLFENIGDLAKYSHFNMAVILDSQGKSQEAIEHLVACVQVDPSLDYAWARAARILGRLNRLGEARIMVEQGLLSNPKSRDLETLEAELGIAALPETSQVDTNVASAPTAVPQARRGGSPLKQKRGKKRN